MGRDTLSAELKDAIRRLYPGQTARVLSRAQTAKARIIPKQKELTWEPDLCLADRGGYHIIQEVVTPDVPEWLKKRIEGLKSKARRTRCSLLVKNAEAFAAIELGGKLLSECINLGAGLILICQDQSFLVFPPAAKPNAAHESKAENGHIPSWVLRELRTESGFSLGFKRTLDEFIDQYLDMTARRPPSFNHESDLLFDFAKRVAAMDQRLFIPVDRLHLLKEWERTSAPPGHRDHFFHTFNNLFLGYLILAKLSSNGDFGDVLSRLIKDSKTKVKPWEIIWLLTCLFHDPGYLAEKFGATMAFDFGLTNQVGSTKGVPQELVSQINNEWETSFGDSSNDLLEIFERSTEEWTPSHLKRGHKSLPFLLALRETYFDGNSLGHSVVSALTLMHACKFDKAKPPDAYDNKKAWTACVIAALSMMFHDQKCRAVFAKHGIQPVSFERLPCAAALVFVDALQEDRRNISENVFRRHGVLESMTVSTHEKPPLIRAVVCLPELPLEKWPGKIMEFESVTRWVNKNSRVRFEIDYQSRAWRF